jgi:hypothetical protein
MGNSEFDVVFARAVRALVVSRRAVTDAEAAEWLDEFAKLQDSGPTLSP